MVLPSEVDNAGDGDESLHGARSRPGVLSAEGESMTKVLAFLLVLLLAALHYGESSSASIAGGPPTRAEAILAEQVPLADITLEDVRGLAAFRRITATTVKVSLTVTHLSPGAHVFTIRALSPTSGCAFTGPALRSFTAIADSSGVAHTTLVIAGSLSKWLELNGNGTVVVVKSAGRFLCGVIRAY